MGEIRRFQDILQGDFVDSYDNLTLKTLLILKTMSEIAPCRRAHYLLKCDIDVFVNVPRLVAELQKYKSQLRNILGYTLPPGLVYRNGKYAITVDEYPLKRYPRYSAGPAYVISNDLSYELFKTSEYVPFFRIKDVYVTGILPALKGGVVHVALLGVITRSAKPLTGCDVITNRLTTRSEVHSVAKLRIWKAMQGNRNSSV